MTDPRFIFKSTGAIGDMIIASALHTPFLEQQIPIGIISTPYTLGLWDHFRATKTYNAHADPNMLEFPRDAIIVDISQYLRHFPHSSSLPILEEKAHLCNWMAYEAIQKHPELDEILTPLEITKNNIKIILTKEEIEWAGVEIQRIREENGNMAITILAPYSNTPNRNIPMQTLEAVVAGLKESTTLCQLKPYKDHEYVKGTKPIGNNDLRKVAALLLQADAYVGVDSGPLHMVNGAMQGTLEYDPLLNEKRDPRKVIVVLGSSHPDVVAYEENNIIRAEGTGCCYAPCGAHGYLDGRAYADHFRNSRFQEPNINRTERSACIFDEYKKEALAPCMGRVNAEEIIEAVRHYLGERK